MIRTLVTSLEQVQVTEYKVEPLSKEDRALIYSDSFSDGLFSKVTRSTLRDRLETRQKSLRSYYESVERTEKVGLSLGFLTSPVHFDTKFIGRGRDKIKNDLYLETLLPLDYSENKEARKLRVRTCRALFQDTPGEILRAIPKKERSNWNRLFELCQEMFRFYMLAETPAPSFPLLDISGVYESSENRGTMTVWLYQGRLVMVKDIPEREVVTRVKHYVLKELKAFKKLKSEVSKYERFEKSGNVGRTKISDDVRMFVWRRDEGVCVVCGGNENLEFDHIIPVSKGGSNTERNLQLLCEGCNREKGATI